MSGQPQVSPLRIIIADDLPDTVDSMALILQAWGHEVQTAGNGKILLERARESRPDVMLVDLGMPVMDGFALASAVRKSDDLCDSILIAITGYADPESAARCYRAGFDFHTRKPVNLTFLEELLTYIRKSRVTLARLPEIQRASWLRRYARKFLEQLKDEQPGQD